MIHHTEEFANPQELDGMLHRNNEEHNSFQVPPAHFLIFEPLPLQNLPHVPYAVVASALFAQVMLGVLLERLAELVIENVEGGTES